jgi:hypothetical protein
MIGNQQQLPQVRLICSSGNLGGEIYLRIQGQALQLLTVATESSDTLIPGKRGRRGSGFGPVVIRPAPFLVRRIDAELQNVVLGDAKVLEQLPGRVGKACRDLSPETGGESRDNLVEAGMRVVPIEQTSNARADLRVQWRSRSPCPRTPPDEARVQSRAHPHR